jgi:hypothetical protein
MPQCLITSFIRHWLMKGEGGNQGGLKSEVQHLRKREDNVSGAPLIMTVSTHPPALPAGREGSESPSVVSGQAIECMSCPLAGERRPRALLSRPEPLRVALWGQP